MQNEWGNLSIDFLAGITIFMLALIWVATMIPGLLIDVQTKTIDVDAISYRTGVILTEDPGMPISPPWENKNDYQKSEVERFGLAASKDTPNILKMAKIERFFCATSFSYPTDYKNRLIFGDRPYGFNITLSTFDAELSRSLGDLKPEEYGYIRRLVKIKYPSNTTIDAQALKNSENVTQHVFSIQLNFTELIGNEPNFAYQINPRRDQLMVNFTNLSGARVFTPATNRITLNSIDIYRRNPLPPYTYSKVTVYANDDPKFRTYVDGSGVTATLPSLVNDNVSVIFSSGFFYGMADDYSTLKISYTFNLTDPDNFFNNSFTSPYSYNYSPAHVTQPRLKEGVLEVATWTAPYESYALSLITATPTPVQPPVADFYGTPTTGGNPLLVAFTDVSTGVPTTWNWTFGDIGAGNTSTLQNPTHTYTSGGSYSVNLTVSNVYGSSTLIKTNYITVTTLPPVAAFSGTPLSGTAPLSVIFTDTSSNTPNAWSWGAKNLTPGNDTWFQFSNTKDPIQVFGAGNWSINLTATNFAGSNISTQITWVNVTIPLPPGVDFSGTPLSGTPPLSVAFTDTSTNTPTSWKWEYRNATVGWTQFSTAQNPSFTFPVGVYSINLTASNAVGSANLTRNNYITVANLPWYCGWGYRKNITIDHTKVPADQTNFPVLVNLGSDTDLAAHARSDAYDLLFTSSDGTTKLSHEIENFTKSNGALVTWVKVPTISSAADTTIIMYYGCATATNQQNVPGVWDTGFKGVWHLNEATGVTAVDSTSNANSAKPVHNPAASTGQIGGALTFASPDNLTIAAASSLDLTKFSDWTMSAWVEPTSYTSLKWPIIYSYGLYRASMGLTVTQAGADGLIENWINDTQLRQSTNPVTLNAWNHVAITRTATTTTFYLNGNADGSSSASPVATANQASYIGGYKDGKIDYQLLGLIDEVRLSASNTTTSARSANWILTEYRNQYSPGTFYSLGSQQTGTC